MQNTKFTAHKVLTFYTYTLLYVHDLQTFVVCFWPMLYKQQGEQIEHLM